MELAHGRMAGLSAMGDPLAERLVLLCHATPGAGGFDPAPSLTATWGVHILSLDRPGYGSTDPEVGDRSFSAALWADDVADYLNRTEEIADAISNTDFGSVGVIGWREGGLFAAALAARHPRLVDRIAFVGTPRPSNLCALADQDPATLLDATRFATTLNEMDGLGYSRRIDRMLTDAGLQGMAGIESDLGAFVGADLDFAMITSENLYLYGARDDLATATDADWFTENTPKTTAYQSIQGGRDLITVEWRRILEHVAPQHGRIGQLSGPEV